MLLRDLGFVGETEYWGQPFTGLSLPSNLEWGWVPHEQSCFMQPSLGLVGDSSVEGESWLAFGILSVLDGDLFEPESQYVAQAGLGLKIPLSQPSEY